VSKEPTIDRREFLRSLARSLVLGALLLGGGWLVGRSGSRCLYGEACTGCPAYADCSLPEREANRNIETTAPAGKAALPGGEG